MSYSILNPLFPQPAYSGNSLITSQATTVTAASTTVTGFVPSTSVGQIQLVSFSLDGGPIRVFWEGSTPTSTTGHKLPADTAYTWSANQFNNSKFILDATATSCIITASPFNGG